MLEQISIVIPTKGRPDLISTNVESQILIVDKCEFELYKEHNPNSEICICPDFNSLALKRNWILDKFGDVFMLDDDIISVMNLTDNNEETFLSSVESKNRIQWIYEKAIDLNIYLFGFNNSPQLIHYNAMKPIMFKGFINGSAIGIRKNEKLRFTEKTIAVEDYYINLLNAYLFRKNLIDKRFCFKQKDKSTFISKGGQSKNRTLETEKRDSLFLRKMFGESIVIKKQRNLKEKSNEYQRQLNIRL
jgi:hypothetical protein